jgi:hypothetical protein
MAAVLMTAEASKMAVPCRDIDMVAETIGLSMAQVIGWTGKRVGVPRLAADGTSDDDVHGAEEQQIVWPPPSIYGGSV